jgi:membrane associated rhomboid family serine protease
LIPLKDNIPTVHFPVITVALIVLNIGMYFFFQHGDISLGEPSGPGAQDYRDNVIEYGSIPYEITHPGEECAHPGLGPQGCTDDDGGRASTWLTLLTSMFMHGGLLHLGGNMLFLWIFGNNIEDAMGRVKFVAFYLLGGLAATFAQTLIDTNSTVPSIGASGAVAAVLGGYALLYPRARVVTLVIIIVFITLIELPALLVLGLWFLFQLYDASLPATGEAGGVAYFAHIGGFVFGLLMIKLFASRENPHYGSYNPRAGIY